MPPKKKEKAGKGSNTGPKADDEPGQPAQDAPFCLSLLLEVCLDAAQPRAKTAPIEGAASEISQPPPRDSSRGYALCSIEQIPPLLVDPVFRYTFVNGDKITTPPVGQPGSSWVHVPSNSDQGAAAAAAKTAVADGREAEVGVLGGEHASSSAESKPAAIWRYTRVHQLEGENEEEVALKLDHNPFMQVTLADASPHGATVQPRGREPGSGTGDALSPAGSAGGAGATNETTIPGRNFIDSWTLDLSGFLAGEHSVDVFVGNSCESDDNIGSSSSRQDGRCPERGVGLTEAVGGMVNDAFGGKREDAPPAPEGIRHMRLSVCLSCQGVQGEGDTIENLHPEGRERASYCNSTSVARTKLLSDEAMGNLNPLSITISSAVSLPGVRIEAESLQKYVQPNPFKLLEMYCKPVYVVCRPFPVSGDPSFGGQERSLHPRVLWTSRSAQRDRARFGHTSAFLLGRMDRHRLEEWAENSIMSMEVHDRDPALSEKERQKHTLRLERMVAGGYPIEDSAIDSLEGGNGVETEGNGERGGGSASKSTKEGHAVSYGAPRDIYEVDALVLREEIARTASAGKECAHGVACFRLSGLVDQSRQLISAYSNNSGNRSYGKGAMSAVGSPTAVVPDSTGVAPRLKMRSEICQRKRRDIPKGGIEEWHLSDGERFVRWPGAYLDAGSTLGIRLSLARPLRTLKEGSAERTGPVTEEPRPFTRAVFIVEYEEGGALVRAVTAAMDEVNGKALKSVQGSLRAYRLTSEEKQAADNGTLDVVCGFTVIDEDSRTIVLEGMAGRRGGLTMVLERVGRAGANGQQYRALENPQVRFARRLYTCFDADLKKVRLRDPLPILCRYPEIYDRAKVSAECFDALHSLRMLRKVDRMREAAEHGLFLEASQLVQVESKYGESVSVKDITGCEPVKKKRGRRVAQLGVDNQTDQTAPGAESVTLRGEHGVVSLKTTGNLEAVVGVTATSEEIVGRNAGGDYSKKNPAPPARRKAPTDATNEAFEEWLRGRKPRDFLAEQEEVTAKNFEEFAERRRRRQEELQGETVKTDWCYGSQKLNYVELKKAKFRGFVDTSGVSWSCFIARRARHVKDNFEILVKAEMRDRLAKDKSATYTYSMDYVSQTVSLVDESRLKEDQEAKSKAAWKTKRGFIWPCPRTRQELITHPKKPSESRIDTLSEPWVENELTGGADLEPTGGSSHGGHGGKDGPPADLAWRREFDTVPSNGKAIFGGLQAPKYGRGLDTSLIGSRSRLPRGRQQLDKDPDFSRSVHLVGDGLALEKAEAKRKAEELWRSKVVVDDTDFRVGKFSVRDTPLQVDRAKDILQLPVTKKTFKIVRNARLPSGKRVPLHAPPVSAFSAEPFVEPEDFTVSIRGNHRERWAAVDSLTGEKLDFYLRLHSDRMKPESHKVCTRTKHPPLRAEEMRGARWETGRAPGRGERVERRVVQQQQQQHQPVQQQQQTVDS